MSYVESKLKFIKKRKKCQKVKRSCKKGVDETSLIGKTFHGTLSKNLILKKCITYHYFFPKFVKFTTLNLVISSNFHSKSCLPHVIECINYRKFS